MWITWIYIYQNLAAKGCTFQCREISLKEMRIGESLSVQSLNKTKLAGG